MPGLQEKKLETFSRYNNNSFIKIIISISVAHPLILSKLIPKTCDKRHIACTKNLIMSAMTCKI